MSGAERLIVVLAVLMSLSLLFRSYRKELNEKTELAPAVGGILTLFSQNSPEFLDPLLARTEVEVSLARMLYRGLMTVDGDGQLVPELAESGEWQENGRAYKVVLKEGPLWHDGQPVVADDVLATIEAVKNPANLSPYQKAWSEVDAEAADQRTVIFRLKSVYAPFPELLILPIVPAHGDPQNRSRELIGNGPYLLSSKVENKGQIKSLTLKRFKDFKPEPARIARIVWQFGTDGGGQPDAVDYEIELLRDQVLFFNLDRAVVSKIETRRAIRDRKESEPIGLQVVVSTVPEITETAKKLKSELEPLGVKLDLIEKNQAVILKDTVKSRDFDGLLVAVDRGIDPDPYPYWHSSQIGEGLNVSGFKDKEADQLLEEARLTIDQIARAERYVAFQKILDTELPAIVLGQSKFRFKLPAVVKGVEVKKASRPADRFFSLEDWYIKTKRVRKDAVGR